MNVTDAIRRHIPENETSSSAAAALSSARFPPGLVEGATAMILTGALLLPVRRYVLKAAGKQLRMFADLVASTGLVIGVANAGMYTGSLYGSRIYLQKLASIPPSAPSATADAICQDEAVLAVRRKPVDNHVVGKEAAASMPSQSALSSVSWDPRVQTMLALQQALDRCQQRQQYSRSTRSSNDF